MRGTEEKHPRALSLMKAQAAVAKLEEFQGNVAFVGTRDFFRPKDVSPSGQAYHWNSNAETYYLIGAGMGEAMMGTGRASGDNRARDAAEAAIRSPLLEDVDLHGARGILVNVTAGLDMAIGEFEEVDRFAHHLTGALVGVRSVVFLWTQQKHGRGRYHARGQMWERYCGHCWAASAAFARRRP